MGKYIPLDALVAEIEKIKEGLQRNGNPNPLGNLQECLAAAEIEALNLIKDSLDTLEVKEVDLDGERRKYLTEHFNVYEDGILQSKRSNLPLDTYDVIKIAKHFFEFGLSVSNKAQKGE